MVVLWNRVSAEAPVARAESADRPFYIIRVIAAAHHRYAQCGSMMTSRQPSFQRDHVCAVIFSLVQSCAASSSHGRFSGMTCRDIRGVSARWRHRRPRTREQAPDEYEGAVTALVDCGPTGEEDLEAEPGVYALLPGRRR